MGSRNNAIGVDTLGRPVHHCLEVLPEVGGLEVRVEFLGGDVAQVFGVFGDIVAAQTPRQLVFGKITGDELDRVEGESFTGLTGGQNPVENHFLGDLNWDR